ncbi:MAG TPA: biopolymer transporter ExbD [Kiritimatiellia bacterium]|jgi:biopolymer transport protein ExbD|nr:biopolymer transporter ExbD [Kiritimatiellia bacterium]OQC58815.1 MAG: Biopolymer transport protein ExbD [Verrucomicrobia bacterium ADurb.Bin018]HOD99574.1 biopolymer transporter ExbD [Kiritimatiellia bacterium]HOE35934.1 biopolymer transporter ExbD [Kiritimatiellia bacterium]HOR73234.1 biopolymer transporter ExbD [Kiritimatiellia bacterium]
MNFRKKLPTPGNLGVPLTPMIDVVFLLLCFFVTSQIFAQWETEIDIALPTAATGDMPQRLPGEVIINVLADGTAVVNGQTLDDAALRAMMDRLVQLFPGQPVLLRADKSTAYEHVVRVLDTCRQADIWNISFATLAPGS